MKIVKFKDGTYGVRRWFSGYEFLSHNLHWHSNPETVNLHCRFHTLDDARKARGAVKSGQFKV